MYIMIDLAIPKPSKTDDKIIIKSMENDDVVLDAQSIRIC